MTTKTEARPAVSDDRPGLIHATPVRHPGRWVAIAVIVVLALMFLHLVIFNPAFNWPLVFEAMIQTPVIEGFWTGTILVTIFAMIFGVALGVLLDTQWQRLATLLGRPELAEAPGYATTVERIRNRAAVNALVSAWASERKVAEAVSELVAADVPAAKVQTFAEAAREPAVLARDMLQTPSGTIPLTGPAAKLSRTPLRVRSAAPTLGQHNEEILDELGVSAEEQRRLRELGVL